MKGNGETIVGSGDRELEEPRKEDFVVRGLGGIGESRFWGREVREIGLIAMGLYGEGVGWQGEFTHDIINGKRKRESLDKVYGVLEEFRVDR